MKKFAISDIHGCAASFQALLDLIGFSKADELYLLGDYIDRGPDSKGVIDNIWQLQQAGYHVRCLRGNHEQIMLDARHDFRHLSLWLTNGGDRALASFGAKQIADIPRKYIEWMDQLPYYFEVDEYILVHAGFRFDMPDPFDEKHAMIWQRNWYHRINQHWLKDRVIVHGHTPSKKEIIQQQLESLDALPALVIDNGCVYNLPGLGNLIAMDLGNRELYFQPRVDF